MPKITTLLCLLAIFIGVAFGQFPGGPPHGPPPPSASSTTSTTQAVSQSTSTKSSHNTKAASTATNTKSSPTASNGGSGSTSGPGVSGAEGTSDSSSSSSGLSTTEKIGLGVGVGIGVAVIAAVGAMFLFARRRRRNTEDSGSFPEQTDSQPAMRWGPPPPPLPLVGAAAVGRRQSPSVYSEPVTSSTRSMSSMGSMNIQEPLDTTIASLSQQLHSRLPPRLAIPSPSPEEEDIIPEQKAYFEHGRPSPLGERPGVISPVSAVSPADSRPPSPLKDHEK